MINKYWKEELNKNNEPLYTLYLYTLYFELFENKEELIRFSKDKDGDYVYSSELLGIEHDYLDCYGEDSIGEVKKYCEEMIEEYYEDKINYYETLLKLFKEE